MEVPDSTLYLTRLLSLKKGVGEFSGVYAANIFTPGALISGCNVFEHIYPSKLLLQKKSNERIAQKSENGLGEKRLG